MSTVKRDQGVLLKQEQKQSSGKTHCSSVSPVRVSQFLFNVDKMKEDVNASAVASREKSNTADQNVLASMQAAVSSNNSSKNQDNSD